MNAEARRSYVPYARLTLAVILPLALFLVLVAPSVLSYAPYRPAWDDTYFFHRAVCFHDAVYALDLRAMAQCYASLSKSPILTFTTLPWGRGSTGEAAVPLALIGLAILIWIFVLAVYRVAVRSGASPWALLVAGMTVWLNPLLGIYGGSFLSDILLAWCTLLLMLLIPLELRSKPGSRWRDIARGLLWGFVVFVGVLAKVTFLLFLTVIGIAILLIRFRRLGLNSCLRTAAAAFVFCLPAVAIWVVFGKNFLGHAVGFSFGGLSNAYAGRGGANTYVHQYLQACSWACVPTFALIPYFVWKLRSADMRWLRLVPLALLLFYLAICALSPNGDLRFAFPVMIGLPFVLAAVPSQDGPQFPPHAAVFACALLAVVLCSIPMLARPDMTYVRYAGAVLDQIATPGARILLATESPTLNIETFLLAKEFRRSRMRSVSIDTLVYDSINGRSIFDSFHRMEAADYIIFHKPPLSSEPKWANQFADQFYRYAVEMADETDAPSEYLHVMKVRAVDERRKGVSQANPTLTAIETDPAPPRPGVFKWILRGTSFNPSSSVVVTGAGCEAGCRLNPASVSFKGATELSGVADLGKGTGNYQFQVMNGKLPSNAVSIDFNPRR